ncbi:hypothetical protein [Nocardia fluminea]|uniref:hypothetical protein n=1 Tax=Nocardia fluminea TaxID=134984 RepID=UPI00341B4E0E
MTILNDTTVERIDGQAVSLSSGATTSRVLAAMVVMAQGRRRDHDLHSQLEERGIRSILIGDSRQIGRIGDAVHHANAAIRGIVGTDREPAPA